MNKPEIYRNLWTKLQVIPYIYSLEQLQRHEMNKVLAGACTLSYVLDVPPKDLDEWEESFLSLGTHIDKVTAIRMMGYLPVAISKELLQFDKYAIPLKSFYEFLSTRLLSWELKIPLNTDSNWLNYESFAKLSDIRYDLIFALWEREQIDESIFISPSYAWLLAECAVCMKLIENQETREINYRNALKYVKYLNPISENEKNDLIPIESIESFIKSIDTIFEQTALDFAKNNPDFDENYYSPYIKALKNWFKKYRNDKNLEHHILKSRPLPKQRGRKLGQKNK